MYLVYGDYRHDNGENELRVISKTTVFTPNGRPIGYQVKWTVGGMLIAKNQTLLTAKIKALRLAYRNQYRDLIFYQDNGQPSGHILKGARVVNLTFPTGEGAEYTTYRTYEITLETDTPELDPEGRSFANEGPGADSAAAGEQLSSFSESVEIRGGGPRWIIRQPLVGPPVRQQVAEQTPYRATQQGQATALFDYPTESPPLWPDAQVESPPVRRDTPARQIAVGNAGPQSWEYRTSWSYQFESVEPLEGLPVMRF